MIQLATANAGFSIQRVLGRIQGKTLEQGTVVFIAGMHGNEPAGIEALQRLLGKLHSLRDQLKGEVIALAGNLPALAAGKRYLDRDLNRLWTQDNVALARNHEVEFAEDQPERIEQRDLLQIIDPLLKEPPAKLVFIDLHTTSAASVPFIALNDQLDNRRFASHFPVPGVLGLEEYLEGPLLSYLNETGHISVAFEAGQHHDARSVDIHESFAWMVLVHAGLLLPQDIPDLALHNQRLSTAASKLSGMFEVIYRHEIKPEDEFAMNPGYVNFAKVTKSEPIASHKAGTIRPGHTCRIFMPLYQSIGSEGFFLVRRIPRWALTLSALLRKFNFERLLTLLPGVSRSPNQPDTLVVNRHIAKYLAKEIFHLLGYRRKKKEGHLLLFSRREITSRTI